MKFINLKQGTTEWHQYRLTRIGASDVANLTMTSSHTDKSKEAVAKSKLTPKYHGAFLENLFRQGHYWEEQVRDNLSSQGYIFQPVVVEDEHNDRLFCSLDGYDPTTDTILEVKWTSVKDLFQSFKDGKLLKKYQDQVQWQLYITKAKSAWLVMVHEGESHTQVIEPDEAIWTELHSKATDYLTFFDNNKERILKEAAPESSLVVEDEFESDLSTLNEKITKLSKEVEELKKQKEEKAKHILEKYQTKKLNLRSMKVEMVSRIGAVDYTLVPQLKDVDLEPYRKKPSEYVKVTISTTNQ